MKIDSLSALNERHPSPPGGRGKPVELATSLTQHYRALVEASPFAILATLGPDGLDCTPRGDAPGFVRVMDEATLIVPNRLADRVESLRNILSDARVALLFMIPASATTLLVTGRAGISADPDMLASFGRRDAPPTALVVTVDTACFQPPNAVLKSALWSPVTWANPDHLPSQTEMLQAMKAMRTSERLLQSV